MKKRLAAGLSRHVTDELAAFIAALDTAFLATVSAAGAPYIQHRGGPKGFIKVLDDKTLGFADYAGNRQYITLSNLAENERAYLFLLDSPRAGGSRCGGAPRVVEGDPSVAGTARRPRLSRPTRARDPVHGRGLGRELLQHITPRFTEAEVLEATAPLRDRIAELEAENARLRVAATALPESAGAQNALS